ncbi:hypothetical protein V7138_09320 [Bacillus sp. JJ1533]|uniref:hypothetical protein n=1 Tax=Bacillus sp. JJ1533 TaxID=3122959 RepID=UPI002FFFA0D8
MKKRKKRKSKNGKYTFSDFLADVFFAIPEIIFFPIRVLIYVIRGFFRLIIDLIN